MKLGSLKSNTPAGQIVVLSRDLALAKAVPDIAQTREIGPGSIFGGGTVSSRDPAVGSSCIAERRAIETTAHGEPQTEFMTFGGQVRIEMLDAGGASIFGAIDQKLTRPP
jgi:fumarylacetoacetate (FAA) hydrolase